MRGGTVQLGLIYAHHKVIGIHIVWWRSIVSPLNPTLMRCSLDEGSQLALIYVASNTH